MEKNMKNMCCCSVTKLYPTVCSPMDSSMPGFSVLHYLPRVSSNSRPLSQWCYLTISSSVALVSFCLQSFPASGSSPTSFIMLKYTWHKIYCLNHFYGEGNGTPLQYSCLENPMDGGAWGLQSMGSQRVGHNWAISLSLFFFHALEKEMATHSSILAWRIPGMAEPGGLPSMGSQRVGHDWSDLA